MGEVCLDEFSHSPISSFIIIRKPLDNNVGMKRGNEFRKQGE